MRRLVFIGLDAADVTLIQRWADIGLLNTFSKILAQNKTIHVLNSPGLYVGSIWPTFFMGSTPAWHGRYCWRQLRSGTYEDEFFQSDQIVGEPIWDKLDMIGKPTCVIDIPKSIPGNRFKGRFVKDWGTHDPSIGGFKIYGWVNSKEFIERYGHNFVDQCDKITRTEEGFTEFRNQLIKRVFTKASMLCDVLIEKDHEAIISAFSESHCVGHQCWHIHDSRHEQHDQALRLNLGDPVLDVYTALDKALGLVLTKVNKCDIVMLLASHGMGTHYNGVELLNSIILELESDFLSLTEQMLPRSPEIPNLLSLDSKDFRRKLRVFPIPNNGAYAAFRLNIVGREPDGKLHPHEVNQYLDNLNAILLNLRNADTGEKIFISSVFPKQTYLGPLVDSLPDLLLEWNRSSPIKRIVTPRSTILVNSISANPRTGDHNPHGALWVLGQGSEMFDSLEFINMSDISNLMMRVL